MATIQQDLVIRARADVADAKQGIASLDQTVDGLASAQEGLKAASADAVSGLAAETSAAQAATAAVKATAKASEEAASAASKLEGEAKGAGSGMDKAAGEARKLTDQLKEVGDGLDVAAGKMIEGIGGPKAIKAIAGAGMALGALKEIAGAFLESSEALFKSWGEQGLQVWDVTERSLFRLKGQFAGVILGTDDMYLAAGRLATGFETLSVGAQMLFAQLKEMFDYSPGGQAIKWLFDVTGATEGYAEMVDSATARIKRQVEAQKQAATAAAQMEKPLGTVREQYSKIVETVDRLLGREKDKAAVERESTIQRLKDLQTLAIAEERAANLKAIRDNAELKRAEFSAQATRDLQARARADVDRQIREMGDVERALLRAGDRREMEAARLAELVATERPALIEAQMAVYRREATALLTEMAPEEAATLAFREQLQYQINDLEKLGTTAAANAGNSIGVSLGNGIASGLGSKEPEDRVLKVLADLKAKADAAFRAQGPARVAAMEAAWAGGEGLRGRITGAADAQAAEAKAAADKAAADQKAAADAAKAQAERKASADAAKAAAEAQIKAVQDTSGAVLDLADAFATLGGVQNDVVSKMRQVVDVVIKIMQATEALSQVQIAQAATATASAAATSAAATSAATATATAGAAGASAFVPVLGAVTAAIGLIGSLFGGEGSAGPQRRTRPRTIYTSAGESQGAGGDFAYFEGGRSNVTIVTNDAASIRAMQGRLSFVAGRGGSGF